ncbi:hypothetical protein GCWU000325_00750 [Alloprevotella tannerae ATCC 51259]|uniref:Uncharacterized protein n=1 Tax=Alloprevotella tannerae ATCC 51259 TaxID=626522 RepID=C9LEW9_9BACT|nr:hypothetical protein GCWU000325_00750 [Alloprevotella tannerae ATCC 51259]
MSVRCCKDRLNVYIKALFLPFFVVGFIYLSGMLSLLIHTLIDNKRLKA